MEPSAGSRAAPSARVAERPRARGWARRAATGALGLVAAALLLELLARVFLPLPEINSGMVPDARLGFRMAGPVTLTSADEHGRFPFRANSLGQRGPELPEPGAAPAAPRVLLVGDSFVNAWAVREEEWIGTLLRAELAAAGASAEVYALAQKDYGTAQELLLLREHGPRVRPASVVLFLFPANDLVNNTLALAGCSTVSAGDYFRPYLVPDGGGGFAERYALPWTARLRRSRVFALLEARWLEGREQSELFARLTGRPWRRVEQRIARGELPEEFLEVYREPQPGGAWETAWSTTEALIRACGEEARGLGARFLVVVIPHMFQVEHTAFTQVLDGRLRGRSRPPLAEALDWNRPEQELERFFHAESIEHVQLLGVLRRELAGTRRSPFVMDGHLDGRGHALMAELLAPRLSGEAGSLCYARDEAASPVDVAALFPDRPLRLDFNRRSFRELFEGGWSRWRTPEEPGGAGWLLEERGTLLVPAQGGTLTLRGELAGKRSFPVTLRVASRLAPDEELGARELGEGGAFEVSFPLPQTDEDGWLPIQLGVSEGPAPGATPGPRLLLTALEVGA